MKYPYLALLAMLALLLPAGAFARDKSQHSVDISDAVQVAGTQLQPGTYKVEWQGAGPGVQVSFLQHGKTVATVPGTLTTNESPDGEHDVVTAATGSNTRALTRIDFGRAELVFEQSGM